jgi:O-antigen polysaccharide polymerase Wzy
LLNQFVVHSSRARISREGIALFHLLVLMLVIMLCLEFADLSLRAVLLIALACSLYLPIIWRLKQLDLFEPIVFANFALGIMFVARPLSDAASDQFMLEYLKLSIVPQFNYTLAVVLAGVVAFQIGYHSKITLAVFPALSSWLPRPSHKFRTAIAGRVGIILAAVGLGLFAIFVMQQGLGAFATLMTGRGASDDDYFKASTGYFYQGLLLLVPASAIMFAVGLNTKKVRWYMGSAICLLIFAGYFSARGDRSHLLPALSIPIFWYLFSRRRPRGRNVLIFAAIAISAISIMRGVRNVDSIFTSSDIKSALLEPWNAALETLQGADVEMFDYLASELMIVPSALDYQHGAIITDIVVRAIPRPLWPGKPTEATDLVGQTLWPEHYAVARAGPSSSILGNLYVDSGVYTVVLGMFLTGAILRWLWLWYLKYADSMTAQLLYASTLPVAIIFFRGTFPDTFSRMLFLVVPLLVAQQIVSPRGSPASGE